MATFGNLLWFRLMCSWRLDGWMMGFSQRVFHEWFSPVCVLRWCFTDLEPENFFSQNLQENGFSPVWILRWDFNWLDRLNLLPHLLQPNGFSPLCTIACLLISLFDVNVFSHCSQLYTFELTCKFLLCLRISLLSLKDFPHDSQSNNFSLLCVYWCLLKTPGSLQSKEHNWHLWGLSPVWTRMWLFSPLEYLNDLSHILHSNGFTSWWRFLWFIISLSNLKSEPQSWNVHSIDLA